MRMVMSDVFSNLGDFFTQLFSSISSGIVFFGGPFDMVLNLVDIVVTTLVVYYILRLMADTRAWQLLRGIILILTLTLLCELLGLETIGYILNNSISVLAIAFVVVFQPELRRALETVGRNTFHLLPSRLGLDEEIGSASIHKTIEAIVIACERMAATYTGALIIIERSTRLGELLTQENVVTLDSNLSATTLMQIFYKGSPLHDGAVLIRNGRIQAARCHVPLSDNYHLRRDYGTRHRAAVGVSEMGDAIAVVVSEERGAISVALDGRLFTLENADALRTLLHKLMTTEKKTGGVISSLFGRNRRLAQEEGESAEDGIGDVETPRIPKRRKRWLMIASFAIAVFVWLFVQTTTNPVETRAYTVQLESRGAEVLRDKGLSAQMPVSTVTVDVRGRLKSFASLSSLDIEAYIDFSQIEEAAVQTLDIQIEIDALMHFEVVSKKPTTQTVNIYSPSGG